MAATLSSSAERARGALGAGAVVALLGWLLIGGLAVSGRMAAPEAMRVLDFALPAPPPPEPVPPPRKHAAPRPEGAAAPPNRVSRATEIVAPPAPVPAIVPVIVAAPVAATGSDASSGNAPVAGPGTGAGGDGNGTGSGGAGNGSDGGGGTTLRWLRGELTPEDYPRAALRAGASGTVGLRFVVGVEGRVTECTVTRSSGNADLDATTCRLIQRRFRYAPSRDAQGRPIPDVVTGEHVWELWRREGADVELD